MAVGVGLACLAGCQEFEQAPHCGPLAGGGCPSSQGGSCEDKLCDAIYTCTSSGWVLDAICDRDGGAMDADAQAADAPWKCTEAGVELEGSVSGCDPNELFAPDCPVQAALGCPETACLTGCSDFFQCTTDGWVAVAYCDEDTGSLVWVDGF